MHELVFIFLILGAAIIYVNYYLAKSFERPRSLVEEGGIPLRELTGSKCLGFDNLGGYDIPTDANAY